MARNRRKPAPQPAPADQIGTVPPDAPTVPPASDASNAPDAPAPQPADANAPADAPTVPAPDKPAPADPIDAPAPADAPQPDAPADPFTAPIDVNALIALTSDWIDAIRASAPSNAPAPAPIILDALASMSPADKARVRAESMALCASETARCEDNPMLTVDRALYGARLLASAEFDRLAFPQQWNGKALDALTGENDKAAARLMDNGATAPRSRNGVRLAFFGALCDRAGLSGWRAVAGVRLYDHLAPACMDVDKTTLTARFRPGWGVHLPALIDANKRGAGQMTRDALKARIDAISAEIANANKPAPAPSNAPAPDASNAPTAPASASDTNASNAPSNGPTAPSNGPAPDANANGPTPPSNGPQPGPDANGPTAPASDANASNAPQPDAPTVPAPTVPIGPDWRTLSADQIIAGLRLMAQSGRWEDLYSIVDECNSLIDAHESELRAALDKAAARRAG
jgi:hypothetical protein